MHLKNQTQWERSANQLPVKVKGRKIPRKSIGVAGKGYQPLSKYVSSFFQFYTLTGIF